MREQDPPALNFPLSWLELDRDSLLHNFAGIRMLVGPARIMAIVKTNAYGAGAVGIARVLSQAGIDAFGLGSISEGIELRAAGIAGTLLCLTYFTPPDVEAIFQYDFTPTVFTLDAARLLSRHAQAIKRRVRLWIKVDTGLGRLGVPFQSARDFIMQVVQQPELEIEGLFSTLTEDPERDAIQVQRLIDVRRQLPELVGLRHNMRLSIASSNGILSLPASYLDMVRPGIMLLGLEPSERDRMDITLVQQADLRPVVTWKARVAYCKVVGKGKSIGYGRNPALASDTAVATLAVGWADGYLTSMSHAGHVLIRGRRCPVISVTANSTLVDATGLPDVAIGDPVVLLGKQADQEITAAEMARVSGQSVYHLLAAIPRQVPRLWNSREELKHD